MGFVPKDETGGQDVTEFHGAALLRVAPARFACDACVALPITV
jgi:hypothetical protein